MLYTGVYYLFLYPTFKKNYSPKTTISSVPQCHITLREYWLMISWDQHKMMKHGAIILIYTSTEHWCMAIGDELQNVK
jgi:hypothetical protein